MKHTRPKIGDIVKDAKRNEQYNLGAGIVEEILVDERYGAMYNVRYFNFDTRIMELEENIIVVNYNE
mgnify:CR=1 FL=1